MFFRRGEVYFNSSDEMHFCQPFVHAKLAATGTRVLDGTISITAATATGKTAGCRSLKTLGSFPRQP